VKNDQGYWVVESAVDFNNYEIILCEYYKSGVFRVWLKRDSKEHCKCLKAFSKKEFLPNDIEAHNKYWVSQ